MKKLFRRISACVLALCLISMNLGVVWADDSYTINKSQPDVSAVSAEARATAAYVLENTSFSSLSDTSAFYNASKNLFLAMRSGYDCSTYETAYYSAIENVLGDDGTINVAVAEYGYPNDIYVCYALLTDIVTLSGMDATDYKGINLVDKLNSVLATATANDFSYGSDPETYSNTGMNPYHIGVIAATVSAFKDKLSDYETISDNIISALETLCSGNQGINYYGTSADNNGASLPGFAAMYSEEASVKAIIDLSVSYVKETFFDSESGAAHNIYQDWYTGATVDEPSPDSTALSLALYAQYGNIEDANATYNALINMFKSQTTPGAYTYYGYDNLYASADALIGLVTYKHCLESKGNPYDVSDILSATDNGGNGDCGSNSSEDNNDSDTGNGSAGENGSTGQNGFAGENNIGSDSPETGDSAYIFMLLYSALALSALTVPVALFIMSKRKN